MVRAYILTAYGQECEGNETMKDKTIFRIYRDGDVIALFPQISASVSGELCGSYMHIGQHGGATPQLVINRTRLAKPKEYAPLLKELRKIGYHPVIAKRFTYKDRQIRIAQDN